MIPAYSPQARGRGERRFETWQGRLPQELRLAGIGTVEEANRFLRERYIPEINREFTVPAVERGHAFVPVGSRVLDRIFSVAARAEGSEGRWRAAPASEKFAPPTACLPARSASLALVRTRFQTAAGIRWEKACRVCACRESNRLPHPADANFVPLALRRTLTWVMGA